MKKIEHILWGIVLIIIGLIVGGNTLGLTNIDIFFNGWWTLFIIVPSFISLFNDNDKTGSIVGLLIGIVLLLGCQDIIRFDLIWKLAFPVILVVIGLSLVFKNVIGDKVGNEIKKLNENNKEGQSYCATFGGQNVNFDEEKFTGADVNAIFGGVKLDLKNAIIDQDVVINASAIFGGIDIYVPKNVKVKTKSVPIFGGVNNKANTSPDEKSHTIYINGTAIFGGIEIK